MVDRTQTDIFNVTTFELPGDHPAPGWAVHINHPARGGDLDLLCVEGYGHESRLVAAAEGVADLTHLLRGLERAVRVRPVSGLGHNIGPLLRSATHTELRGLIKLGAEPEKPEPDHRSKTDQARDAVGNFAQYMAKSGCVARSDVLRLVKHFHIDLLAALEKD